MKSPNGSENAPQTDNVGGRIPFFPQLIATGLYSGYIPWMSGTFGTLVGLGFYLIPGVENPYVLLPLVVAGFFIGVYTSARVAAVVGHRLTRTAEMTKQKFQPGTHETADPSIVVIDEIVGIWLTLLFLPKTLPVMVIGFFAFRAMDILKPQPARRLERIPDGWGIMLDDVVAAVYANIATWVGWYVYLAVFGHA